MIRSTSIKQQNTSNTAEGVPWNDLLGHHQLGLLLSLTARFHWVRLFLGRFMRKYQTLSQPTNHREAATGRPTLTRRRRRGGRRPRTGMEVKWVSREGSGSDERGSGGGERRGVISPSISRRWRRRRRALRRRRAPWGAELGKPYVVLGKRAAEGGNYTEEPCRVLAGNCCVSFQNILIVCLRKN